VSIGPELFEWAAAGQKGFFFFFSPGYGTARAKGILRESLSFPVLRCSLRWRGEAVALRGRVYVICTV
jgi:hypothetical protein